MIHLGEDDCGYSGATLGPRASVYPLSFDTAPFLLLSSFINLFSISRLSFNWNKEGQQSLCGSGNSDPDTGSLGLYREERDLWGGRFHQQVCFSAASEL